MTASQQWFANIDNERESCKNLKEPLEQKQDQALAVDLAVLSEKVILATGGKKKGFYIMEWENKYQW